jgi:hypothetical protein
MDEPLSPQQLAYLAGRGSIALAHEQEGAYWQSRVIEAAQRDRDLFSEVSGHAFEEGDRIVFDQRGGWEHVMEEDD